METIYNVLKPHFLNIGIALDGGTATYENGTLTVNFTINFSPKDLEEEIQRIDGILDPESGINPQHCSEALQYLSTIKTRLGWQ